MFASPELAARIEAAEVRLLSDALHNVRRRVGDTAFARPLAGGVAVRSEAGSPLNKIAGVGFAGVPSSAELDELEGAYAAVDCPVRFEVSTLADPALAATLTRRGYVLECFENVLARPLPVSPDAAPEGIDIAPSPDAELDAWLDVLVSAFSAPDVEGVGPDEPMDRDVLGRIVRDFTDVAGITRYLVTRNGAPAGAGSMRMHEGIALLCGAGTLPPHRRRGLQTALLGHRLAEASRHGCDLATVVTQPGSKSQQNVHRHGFELLYSRSVLVLPAERAR